MIAFAVLFSLVFFGLAFFLYRSFLLLSKKAPVFDPSAILSLLAGKMPTFDLEAIIARLDYLERIIEYDLLMKIAADSIAYAEQKRHAVVRAGGGKADPRQTKDIALHYMQEKVKLLKLTVSSDDCSRSIEAALGVRDRT